MSEKLIRFLAFAFTFENLSISFNLFYRLYIYSWSKTKIVLTKQMIIWLFADELKLQNK